MRILIVEDEHLIATSIKKGLEQEKFTVDIAFSGTQGYDLASCEEYDLIIMDLQLPQMDGITICQKLRKNNNHTPILILTARSQTQDKVHGLDSGADDYLAKPFSFEELLARIRALVRRPQKIVNSLLKVADLSLDAKTFEVKRGKKQIALSNKEFSVLEYLMKHANHTVTKEQIINHVWNYDADILPNTVEVNIRNLRNKISLPSDNNNSLIKTIRGFGYKIEK